MVDDTKESAPAKLRPARAKKTAVAAPVFQPPPDQVPVKKKSAKADEPAEKKAAKKPVKKAAKKAAKKATKKATKDVSAKAAKNPAKKAAKKASPDITVEAPDEPSAAVATQVASDAADSEESPKRRRRRGGRGRRKRAEGESADDGVESETADADSAETRKRRRRRRRGADGDLEIGEDDPPNTIVRVRAPRAKKDEPLRGSTRLEAKKQRRREGREAGRRRAPILTESEFLARREAVARVMVIRQQGTQTQIAVLEDEVLVEHYVTRGSSSSMVGNVYLGRVQNVLPSMEAAFVDIGRGRNAVLYAGEVNWDAAGLDGQPKRIEFALKSGDPVLVQVTKDPVGQKGARLTSQVSIPGRFLVFVPDGSMTGISRKLPDNERSRLKGILKRIMPEESGVIVRTAAEGASEEALRHDIEHLQAQWSAIADQSEKATPPTLLYSEPELATKVVRDMFNEDVERLIISGEETWTVVSEYVQGVAPDLSARVERWTSPDDVFAAFRVDEQLMKALDRKVYLPSGGSLVIDRTEAMTVIDVNTGKFTGQGGNLEQTVTSNNLEAAEEIVRQLRLRDIGGIIVVDFIDMVLESNRDSVIRRLVECLGRDRTKHQVAEVTSLGLVQMTRKRIGSGLLESFSRSCDACNGRGMRVSLDIHGEPEVTSPKQRRPANAVDPADVAARLLAPGEPATEPV